MNTLYPELHVTVLMSEPADPRIESPASEQPRRDIGHLQDRDNLANDTQLPRGLLLHGRDRDQVSLQEALRKQQQVHRSGICPASEILHDTQGRVDVSEDLGRLTSADPHRANLPK
jgi:hypothetical protein